MVYTNSLGFVGKSFALAGYGSLSCSWASKPTLGNTEQTNIATGEQSQHLWTLLEKLSQSAGSHPSEPVCAWVLAKASRELMGCFGAILLAKWDRKWSGVTLTSALLYNWHEHAKGMKKSQNLLLALQIITFWLKSLINCCPLIFWF